HVRFDIGGMGDRTYNFIDSRFDVAFQTKHPRNSSGKGKKGADLKFVLCASPRYPRRPPPLEKPRDPAQPKCLPHQTDPLWRFKHGSRPEHLKIPASAFTSNTYLVLQKAALRGLGIALLPLRPIYEDVSEGRLQVVLPDYPVPDRPLFAVYAPGRQTVRKVRV